MSYLSFSPFPTVAEAVQEELENYRSSEDEVKRLKSAMVGILPCHIYVILVNGVQILENLWACEMLKMAVNDDL